MELILNIILGFFILVFLFATFAKVAPILIRAYHSKRASKSSIKKLSQWIQSFDVSKLGSELGGHLVRLMEVGFIQTLKTENDGNPFPYERQYQNFVRYATPEIARSLKEVGNNFETFVV